MATAAELLADVLEIDRTLVIDSAFRTINIPSSVPNLGVEHDDDVLFLDIKMPRKVSDTDLKGFSIYINYINAKGEPDTYSLDKSDYKPIVGEQYITFKWKVGPTATRYKGNTKFNICAKTLKNSVDENGNVVKDEEGNVVKEIDREFNTTVATLPVLEGLEVDETIVTAYSDIIAQWEDRLFNTKKNSVLTEIQKVSQNEQTSIENKAAEVLSTIPAEYTETAEAAQEGIRTKADAIVCTTQGEVITVSDSSDDHVRNLKILGKTTQVTTTGKQLIKVTKTSSTTNGITYTVNTDGSVHVRGTATGNAYFIIDSNNPISIRGSELIAAISGSDKVYMTIGYFKDDSTIVNEVAYALGNASCSFTYPAEAVTTRTFLGVNTGVTVDAVVYPMIRLATIEDSSYEPYSGGIASPSPDWPQEMNDIENPTISVYGKNLLKLVTSNQTTNGVTFTVNPDNSVSIKGTATASVYYGLNYDIKNLIPGEQYTMTGGLEGSSGTTYRLYAQTIDGKKFYADYGNGVSFTATDEQWQVLFAVYKDTTVDFTIYPVLRLKSVVDATYEPYTDQPNISLQYTLPGIPVTTGGNYTDTNGQQWICDEVDFERAVYIQRVYVLVSDYNGGWKISGNSTTNHNAFYRMNTELPTMIKGTNKPVVCTHFTMTRDPVADHVTCVSGGLSNQEVYFFVPKTDFPDVDTWTNYVVEQANAGTPITTYYILNEPIETPLTAEEIAAFKALHTNYPNTTVLNDAGATMELIYNADTKTWVKNLLDASGKPTATIQNNILIIK